MCFRGMHLVKCFSAVCIGNMIPCVIDKVYMSVFGRNKWERTAPSHTHSNRAICLCEGCVSPSFTSVCVFSFIPFCRAPVLVALALIECGMKYEDAIQFIRQYVQLFFPQCDPVPFFLLIHTRWLPLYLYHSTVEFSILIGQQLTGVYICCGCSKKGLFL